MRPPTAGSRLTTLVRAGATLTRGRAAGGAVVLAYHDVVARDAHGYSVTASGLRRHLRLLRRLRLRIVPLAELLDTLAQGLPVDGLAVLAFDDGLVGVHRYALDVLAEERAPATVFLVSDVWGRPPPWWPGAARTMTRAEVAEAISAGVSLAAHTRTHRDLPGLDDQDLTLELRGCRDDLEQLVQAPVPAVAYPNGLHNARVRHRAAEAGFAAGFTFLNGRIVGTEDAFKLPRLTMTAAHSPARLAYCLTRGPGSWPDHQLDAVEPRPRPDRSSGAQVHEPEIHRP